MATTRVQMLGLSKLGERMRKLSAAVAKKGGGAATGAAANVVKKRAKAILKSSPSVDSGLLEKNVIIKKVGKRDTQLTSEHIVTIKKAEYPVDESGGKRNTKQVGGYVEFGTVNMPAEPYLRPAFDEGKGDAVQAMVASLEKTLAKAGA
jgi:HK97 gp10 family phage protein